MPQRNPPTIRGKLHNWNSKVMGFSARKEAQEAQDAVDMAAARARNAAIYEDALRLEALTELEEKNSNTGNSKTQTELEKEEGELKMQKKIEQIKANRRVETAPDVYNDKGAIPSEFRVGGSRRNKATPKSKAKPNHEDMTMKDIKEMCKANLIKLSKVVDNKRVVFNKKELITKLKRKKLL